MIGPGFQREREGTAGPMKKIAEGFCFSLPPELSGNAHKGDRGGCLVAGGCGRYRGAPLLSLRGFLRAGGGIAVLMADEEVCSAGASFLPEAIFLSGLLEGRDDAIEQQLSEWEGRIGCLIAGPGMGRSERAGEVFTLLWRLWKKKIIIDGDGLYWLKKKEHSLVKREDVLLTPHEGEAAFLLDTSPREIALNREEAARAIAAQWGVVLLKGPETLVDDGSRTSVLSQGTPLLAVPGSGDVLAGAIGAFAARGMTLYESACTGGWVHAASGNLLTEQRGLDGTLAREIADTIPVVLRFLRMDQ